MRAPREHLGRVIRERERAVLAVRGEQPLREQLAHDAAPLLLGEVGADAVGRQRVVARAGGRAAVALPRRMSMRWPAPNVCRRSRCSRTIVDSSFCAGTVPSQASGGSRHVSQLPQGSTRLAEVAEQVLPAALHRLAEREHRVEVLGQAASMREVARALVDHAALLHDVLRP